MGAMHVQDIFKQNFQIFTQAHNVHPIFWLNTKVANLLLGFLVGPLGHGVDSARLTTFQFGGLPVGGLWQ